MGVSLYRAFVKIVKPVVECFPRLAIICREYALFMAFQHCSA